MDKRTLDIGLWPQHRCVVNDLLPEPCGSVGGEHAAAHQHAKEDHGPEPKFAPRSVSLDDRSRHITLRL